MAEKINSFRLPVGITGKLPEGSATVVESYGPDRSGRNESAGVATDARRTGAGA